jgi:hypothetical protein
LYFAYWSSPKGRDPVSGDTVNGNFWNTQLVASTIPSDLELRNTWLALAQRWRLCYQSVTIYQDGPDLANQGTIVVSQAPLQPNYYTASILDPVSGVLYPHTKYAWYNDVSQGPNFQRSQAMPNAYMGRSREGAYIPLKLTETCQDWQSQGSMIVPYQPGGLGSGDHTLWTSVSGTANHSYPFWRVTPVWGLNGSMHGTSIPDLMNATVAHVSARNLSEQTSFTFFFRMGIEVQLAASSSLTPQLKLSPPYDRMALDTYFEVARELKDAYPADYNDLGRMWDVISSAAKTILPALGMLPGVAPFSAPITGIVQAGDAIRKRRNARKVQRAPAPSNQLAKVPPRIRQTPSAAQIERTRAMRVNPNTPRVGTS